MTGERKRPRPGPKTGLLAQTPPEERPREKLLRKGPDNLSDDELLAIILGTGTAGRPVLETARDLLRDGGLPGLFTQSADHLRAMTKGMGAAGREIGVEVKDHVVVGRGRWVSFHERGLLR